MLVAVVVLLLLLVFEIIVLYYLWAPPKINGYTFIFFEIVVEDYSLDELVAPIIVVVVVQLLGVLAV